MKVTYTTRILQTSEQEKTNYEWNSTQLGTPFHNKKQKDIDFVLVFKYI